MIENKAITYSLLAHIRNSGTLIEGPLDIFVPLIKRVLHKLSEENIHSSNNLTPIKNKAEELYNIDFPTPVIKRILSKISFELNTPEKLRFQIHQDNSFILEKYIFDDFEDKLQTSKKEVEKIEILFTEFRKLNGMQSTDNSSVFDFIDKNRTTLSKYFSATRYKNGTDYTLEAKFVDYFKHNTQVYEIIRNIYLGSILTCYIEFNTSDIVKSNVELLFDTNFIVSLLDLNTEESTHTCNKLLDVCKNLGYKFSVLNDTIAETKALIKNKAEYFDQTFLQKRINPEDIYNACERRKFNRADLERISDNVEDLISNKGIITVFDTSSYKNVAKFSKEYEFLKDKRHSEVAALHDATALYYVRTKRGQKKIRDFESVNCWFVNNSISHIETGTREFNPGFQPEVIKADELLNILWLSSPQVKISDNDLIDIGLSSVVAFTLNDHLPKTQIIKELDENIRKYASEGLTSKDILNISTRIVNNQLKNLENLNEIAKSNPNEFIKSLQDEALKQEAEERKRNEKFQELFENLEKHQAYLESKSRRANQLITTAEKTKQEHETKLEKVRRDLESTEKQLKDNEILEEKKRNLRIERFKENEIKEWRNRSWRNLFVSLLLIFGFIGYICKMTDYNLDKTMTLFKGYQSNIIFVAFLTFVSIAWNLFILTDLYNKYRNHSNINSYKNNIKIPDDM